MYEDEKGAALFGTCEEPLMVVAHVQRQPIRKGVLPSYPSHRACGDFPHTRNVSFIYFPLSITRSLGTTAAQQNGPCRGETIIRNDMKCRDPHPVISV